LKPPVLDRTQIQLPLTGRVLGDIVQPLLIRPGGGEVVTCHAVLVDEREEVIVDRRAGLAGLGTTAVVRGEHTRRLA
jgi:hypothetical protein